MKTYYFDWSGGMVNVLREGTRTDDTYTNLDTFLDTLDGPAVLIGEATFESYDLAARARIIQRCQREGHLLLSTPNRQTGRERDRLGLEKSDVNDLWAIRSIARRGVHKKRPAIADPAWVAKREEANKKLMWLRSTYEGPRQRRQALYAQQLTDKLPDFSTLTEQQRYAFGNGTAWSDMIVATVGVCAEFAGNQKEFDRLSGMYHHGYPSLIRSNFMMHGWSKKFRPGQRYEGILTLSQYRRELRWLYRQIRDIIT